LLALPVSDAVIFAVAEVATALLVTVKVAVEWVDVTVTVAGTVAAVVLSLASVTTTPEVGAVVFNVTVPVEVTEPPVTLVGFRATEVICGGFTVRVAVWLELL
jgi:hypothetical protein